MKLIALTAVFAICASCGSGKIDSHKTTSTGPITQLSFADRGTANKPMQGGAKLSEIFSLPSSGDGTVTLSFDRQGDLKLATVNALGGKDFRTFKGKQTRKGFEIYFQKKRIPFPPIYSVTRINRVRLQINDSGSLVVDQYYNSSGMIVFMAAGNRSHHQYTFKQINTNHGNK